MPKEFPHFIPAPPRAAEIFATYQMTHAFYREAEYRKELERYCQWYQMTAEANRQELQRMRGDINIFGWFNRGRR